MTTSCQHPTNKLMSPFVPCGKAGKFYALEGFVTNPVRVYLCGIHAPVWRRRGYVTRTCDADNRS